MASVRLEGLIGEDFKEVPEDSISLIGEDFEETPEASVIRGREEFKEGLEAPKGERWEG